VKHEWKMGWKELKHRGYPGWFLDVCTRCGLGRVSGIEHFYTEETVKFATTNKLVTRVPYRECK